jgi:hypothetical protein
MYFLAFLLIVLFILLTLLALVPAKVSFSYNSELQPDLSLKVSWLSSFLHGVVYRESSGAEVTVYLLDIEILARKLKSEGRKKNLSDYINFIRSINPEHLKAYASYGFEDPSITGISCGAIDMLSESVNFEVLDNNPDFSMDHDHINVNGSAELNVITTLTKLLKLKRSNQAMPVLHGNK